MFRNRRGLEDLKMFSNKRGLEDLRRSSNRREAPFHPHHHHHLLEDSAISCGSSHTYDDHDDSLLRNDDHGDDNFNNVVTHSSGGIASRIWVTGELSSWGSSPGVTWEPDKKWNRARDFLVDIHSILREGFTKKSGCSFGFYPNEGGRGGPCPNFSYAFYKLYILGQFGEGKGGGDPCSNFLARWR